MSVEMTAAVTKTARPIWRRLCGTILTSRDDLVTVKLPGLDLSLAGAGHAILTLSLFPVLGPLGGEHAYARLEGSHSSFA